MTAAMQLRKDDRQPHTAAGSQGFAKHEHGRVAAADFGIDSPSGFWPAIDGFRNVPILLIEIGESGGDRHRLWFASRLGQDVHFDLGEMQVAVVLPARPLVRQAVIGQHFQPQGGDSIECRLERQRVSVDLGTRADE